VADEGIRRDIPFRQVFNFRDLGGLAGFRGRTVRWRRLFRSDSLSGLGEDDRHAFLELGVRTVVDLRRPYEIARQGRVPDWDGLTYHHIDPDHREWTETPWQDHLDPVRYLADRYLDLAEEGADGLAAAVGMVADERAAPVVVHCVAGKDRTGVVCALTLSVLGVSDADIDADYARSTAGSERYLAWARANGKPDLAMLPWFRSPPGAMRLFLSELRERHGSVERYLVAAGLTRGDVGGLRRHLLGRGHPGAAGGRAGPATAGPAVLADPAHPAERVARPAPLDVHQAAAQIHGHLAGPAVGDHERPAGPPHLPDRGEHRRGPAGEHLP
jgi:protein tyrosine/serine phosphatase